MQSHEHLLVVKKRLEQGDPYTEIERITGLRKSAISYYAHKFGIPRGSARRIDWKAVQVFYDKRKSVRQCLSEFSMSSCSWYAAVKQGKIVTRHAEFSYIELWKQGKETGNRNVVEISLSMRVRKYIFEKYGYRCARCGWNEQNPFTKRVPLTVDHINGDAYDSREDNLILLCPNCHSLTSTYGGSNRGRGRLARKRALMS